MSLAVTQLLNQLHSGALLDPLMVKSCFRSCLIAYDKLVISFMHHELLAGDDNLLIFLKNSISLGDKQSEDVRKEVYEFIANYVEKHGSVLLKYAANIFKQVLSFFRQEQVSRLKVAAIECFIELFTGFDSEYLLDYNIFHPKYLHAELLGLMKSNKMIPTVRGALWELLAVVQSNFPAEVSSEAKRIVQEMCLLELKGLVESDKNLSTIASSLRSLSQSLQYSYLDEAKIDELFRYASVLMRPIKQTFDVPKAALFLLQQRTTLFRHHISKDARKLFDNCCELLNHGNRPLKLQVCDTLTAIVEYIVRNIKIDNDIDRKQFEYMLKKSWDLLKADEFKSSLLIIIRVLGIFSPLILELKGLEEYKKFFKQLLRRCESKVLLLFEEGEQEKRKSVDIKTAFYFHKELGALLTSFGRIIEQLDYLDHEDAHMLQKLWSTTVREQPYTHLKTQIPLREALVRFITGLHSKKKIFYLWVQKAVYNALHIQLVSKYINSDDAYYQKIYKATHFWISLLKQTNWRSQPLLDFVGVIFYQIYHLLTNLDCSYRNNLQKVNDDYQHNYQYSLTTLFFFAQYTTYMTNINDYEFLCSIAVLYYYLILTIDPTLYISRAIPFTINIFYRLRLYPKCIPLMKVLRALFDFFQKNAPSSDLLQKSKHFFIYYSYEIFHFYEQNLFDGLKMLLSTPNSVFILDSNEIMKHRLPLLLRRSFYLGQEMLPIAFAAFRCLKRVFSDHQYLARDNLTEILPLLYKFLGWKDGPLKGKDYIGNSFLLLRERYLKSEHLSEYIMSFLGSLGGLCHSLVQERLSKQVSWDYHCKLDVEVVIQNEKHRINIARLLGRVCELAVNGVANLKIYACYLLHASLIYLVGSAAHNLLYSKENLSRLLEKLLPTVILIASNATHPSQQLLHSVLIQTIHFFANSKQQNAPYVQTLLRHLLALYSGAEDLCLLASKCLYEFLKWHIKQQPSSSDYPVLKSLLRGLWPLSANKAARKGLIHLMTKILLLIHQSSILMNLYGIELGALTISLTRVQKPPEYAMLYLVYKYNKAIGAHIYKLVLPNYSRRTLRFETIQIFVYWLYQQCFFSNYSQQRIVGFQLWNDLLLRYSVALQMNALTFLKNHSDKERRFLFASFVPLTTYLPFNVLCSKLAAFGEVWIRLVESKILDCSKLVNFRDLYYIYLTGFVNFFIFFITDFSHRTVYARFLSDYIQKLLIDVFGIFLRFIQCFKLQIEFVLYILYRLLHSFDFNVASLNAFFIDFLLSPNYFVQNFNYDLLYDGKNYFLNLTYNFLSLQQNSFRLIIKALTTKFDCNFNDLIHSVFYSTRFWDREATTILTLIIAVGNYPKEYIYYMLKNVRIEGYRYYIIVWFMLSLHNYYYCQRTVLKELYLNSAIWQRYERSFTKFILNKWYVLNSAIIILAKKSLDVVRFLFALYPKLPKSANLLLFYVLKGYDRALSQSELRELLKFSYLLVDERKEYFFDSRILIHLLNQGVSTIYQIYVHYYVLNLAALVLTKDYTFYSLFSMHIKILFEYYVPLPPSKLSTLNLQDKANRFLKAVIQLIKISQKFSFLRYLFLILKDEPSKQRQTLLDEVITISSSPYVLNWLMELYWDDNLDHDYYANFRCLLIECLFKKMIKKSDVVIVQDLFAKYGERLTIIIEKGLITVSLKTMLMDMQIKKGALGALYAMYECLPKPYKDKTKYAIHTKDLHKRVIKTCHTWLKGKLETSVELLVQGSEVREPGKASSVLREWFCAVYNCLIALFLATQSNREQFRIYLLYSLQGGVCERLVDSSCQDFHFEVETDFYLMPTSHSVAKEDLSLRANIRKHYFAMSLHAITEQIQEEYDGEKEQSLQIAEGGNKMLELDIVNRHPCMMNLLRLVDYFHHSDQGEAAPLWMKPIRDMLNSECSLSARILLTKLVLNRSAIFIQDFWGYMLMVYLSLKNNGGKFIHYLFRDAIKHLLRAIKVGYNPNPLQLHQLTMKVIKALPHNNIYTYTDNMDILATLLAHHGNWIDSTLVLKMLFSEDKEWKLCAVLVLKMALAYNVPAAPPEYSNSFYWEWRKSGVLKHVFSLIQESQKKFKIAAADLLGQYLLYISTSVLSQEAKSYLFTFIAHFLSALSYGKHNREVKDKFTLSLLYVVKGFPDILGDYKLFNAADSGLAQFFAADRANLLCAFAIYAKRPSAFQRIPNIMMTIRRFCESILVDSSYVQLQFSALLLASADHRLLACKEIFETYVIILERIDKCFSGSGDNESALNYYKTLLQLQNFMPDCPHAGKDAFMSPLKLALLRGLGCEFEDCRQLVFEHFERVYKYKEHPTHRLLQILYDIYEPALYHLWLPNVVPLIFSLLKSSSDFNRLLFVAKLYEKAQLYDWDFRNFSLRANSQPYTLREDYSDSQLSQSQHSGERLKGMLRATQNRDFAVYEQVFTNLASQSYGFQSQYKTYERNFARIDTLFSGRKHGYVKQGFRWVGVTSPVQLVEEKLRFRKNAQFGIGGRLYKKKVPKGALLRHYRVGELPDIAISLADIFVPVLKIAQLDAYMASYIFLQIVTSSVREGRSKEELKNMLLRLLVRSYRKEYNFVSTLQKSLTELIRISRSACRVRMKYIAVASNTVDYAIVLAYYNIIQFLYSADDPRHLYSAAERQEQLDEQWGYLLDLYRHINYDDFVLGAVLRMADGNAQSILKQALYLKRQGQIKKCKLLLNSIPFDRSSRFRLFVEREKIDCSALLSEWDYIIDYIGVKLKDSDPAVREYLSGLEKVVLVTALCNSYKSSKAQLIPLIDFVGEQNEYEKGLLAIIKAGDVDKAWFYALNAQKMLQQDWCKTGELACNARHNLLENMQKVFYLQYFLELLQLRSAGQEYKCYKVFSGWSARAPSVIHDSNLSWMQVLESRLLYSRLVRDRQQLAPEILAPYTTEWLVQVLNGMLSRGVLGFAENITRKAIMYNKLALEFSWGFYYAIGTLKLEQHLRNKRRTLSDYQMVPKLVRKEMDVRGMNDAASLARFLAFQNKYLYGYLVVSLLHFYPLAAPLMADQAAIIYLNYEQIKRHIKGLGLHSSVTALNKQLHLQFAAFLYRILSAIHGRFEITPFRYAMAPKNLSLYKLAVVFVQEFVEAIKVLQTRKNGLEDGEKVFALVLKLLKVVQSESGRVGQYFYEALSDPHVPKWLFLSFLPLFIRSLNSFEQAPYFRELFHSIVTHYPSSLVYPFNCTYEARKDCLTEACQETFDLLHKKLPAHFRLIEGLKRLHHPYLRMKEALNKFKVPGESERAMEELKDIVTDDETLGRYNRLFVRAWGTRVRVLAELQTTLKPRDFETELNTSLKQLDTSRDPLASTMKKFTRLADGSTFFENYNCGDCPRIELPWSTQHKFYEPVEWKKILIESFEPYLLTLSSKQKPKRITVVGSDEKEYQLLVKGGEDVRLDNRIEELFDIVNRILRGSTECSKRKLHINRFEVVPMRKMLGVFEWVRDSRTLRQFLDAEYRELKGPEANVVEKNPAYATFIDFIKKLTPEMDRYAWHKALLYIPDTDAVRNFCKCEALMPDGLLRNALRRLSKNVDSYLYIKNAFLANYAAACAINYVLGIGDRHLDNFLIDCNSASIVLIDFGYSFGAGIELLVPYLIPFRLTRSIRELAEPIGLYGVFKRSMVVSLQAMADQLGLIVDYCDVFIDDPLMEWVYISRKLLSQAHSSHPASFSVSQELPERRFFSEKIKKVRQRLLGEHPRALLYQGLKESRHKTAPYYGSLCKTIWNKVISRNQELSIEEVVNELLSLATDKAVLAKGYIGLNLFI